MKKKLITLSATAVMVLALSIPAFAAKSTDFYDFPDNYATTALENAVNNGLLQGDNGYIMPEATLTKAELATIINRAFGSTAKADITKYTDMSTSKWYYNDMAVAVKMQTFVGDGTTLNPNKAITREEAFLAIARALKLTDATSTSKTFTDADSVSSWAKGAVYAMINAGYVEGEDGKINPQVDIKRQEFAYILDKVLTTYITKAGEVTSVASGNVMVNKAGVTIKNATIKGDLIIADGVGQGKVTINNVTVTGRILVRGGGVTLTGKYANVVLGDGVTVDAVNATIEKGSIIGDNSTFTIQVGSTIKERSVAKTTKGSRIVIKGETSDTTINEETLAQGSATTPSTSGGGGGSSSGGGSSTSKPSIGFDISSTTAKIGTPITVTTSVSSVTFTWSVDGITVETGTTYTPTISDLGKIITVTASKTNRTPTSRETLAVVAVTTEIMIDGVPVEVNGSSHVATLLEAQNVEFVKINLGENVKEVVDGPKTVTISLGNKSFPLGNISVSGTEVIINFNAATKALAKAGTYKINVPAGMFIDEKGIKNAAYVFDLVVE